ncbi:MAG TPA: hypothetical protein PKE40_00220 [Arachnia sp.]|nr:hypothetical protein [Arachnia sp.]HMT84749.1 hypothetical protein [Arachnia sp.]
MSNEQRFYDQVHRLAAVGYAWWLIKLNLFVLGAALPLMACILLLDHSVVSMSAAVVSGLLLGPAVFVMLTQILHLDRHDGVRLRDCMRAYRSSFWRVQPVTAPAWGVVFVALGNLRLVGEGALGTGVGWASLAVLYLALTLAVNTLILMAAWPHLGAGQALGLSAKLAIVKALRFQLTLLVIVGTQVLLSVFGSWTLLLAFALPGWLAVVNFRPVIAYVEQRQVDELSCSPYMQV